MWLVRFVIGAAWSGVLCGAADAAIAPTLPPPSQTTVCVDLIVEDVKGEPAANLNADEIVVVQDAVRQDIAALAAREPAGRYEVCYVPKSGKAGAVTMQLLRPGTRARGLDGPALRPRVLLPFSPLESELAALLEARPEASDFRTQISVLRFETTPEGVHHTFAVEVVGTELLPGRGAAAVGRVQIFARVTDAEGRVFDHAVLDRTLPAGSAGQRIVWTRHLHLRPGRYTFETVAREGSGSRASIRRLAFDAPELVAGMRVSSVALLLPIGSLVVRENGPGEDDPLFLKGTALMPILAMQTVAAPGAKLQFFTTVYPDRADAEPVTLRLDLRCGEALLGSAPLALPPVDERGEIRYAGELSIQMLKPAEYRLRVYAQQGQVQSFEEVPFTVTAESAQAPIRIGPAPSAEMLAGAPKPSESPEWFDVRLWIKTQRYEQALEKLKKMEQTDKGRGADIAFHRAIAYYRLRAYKDAETSARRAIELSSEGSAILPEAHIILGRSQAAAEKKDVRADSQALLAASESFARAAVLAPTGEVSEVAHIARAETLYRLQRVDDARHVLQALLGKTDVAEGATARAQQLLDAPRCATEPCLPQLSFVTPDGRHVPKEELQGKVVLLSFWATWCGPCAQATPELKRVYARHEKDPFVMLGVSDEESETIDAYVQKHRMAWAQVKDGTARRLHEAMSVRGLPSEMLFDHEGVLIAQTTGWNPGAARALSARIGEAVGRAKKARAVAAPAS